MPKPSYLPYFDQLSESCQPFCNQGKWRHLVGKFWTNAVSATLLSKLKPIECWIYLSTEFTFLLSGKASLIHSGKTSEADACKATLYRVDFLTVPTQNFWVGTVKKSTLYELLGWIVAPSGFRIGGHVQFGLVWTIQNQCISTEV